MKKVICLFFIFVQVNLYSHVKIGFNSKLNSPNSHFEVELKKGTKFVITKKSVRVGIGNINPTFPLEVMGSNALDAIAIGKTKLMSDFRTKISSQGISSNDRWMKINADWGSKNNISVFGSFRGSKKDLTILENGRISIGNSRLKARLIVNRKINAKGDIIVIEAALWK